MTKQLPAVANHVDAITTHIDNNREHALALAKALATRASEIAYRQMLEACYPDHRAEVRLAYILIVSTITAYGGVNTQQVARFSNYHDCAAFAVSWTDAGRSPDSTVQWACQRDGQ